MEKVENYEFSTFCGKLVAEGNRFGVTHRGCGEGTRLPLFIRGAVTPKGFRGVTERIL